MTTDNGDDPIKVMDNIQHLGTEWAQLAEKIRLICTLEKSRIKDGLSIANHALVLAMRAEIIAIGDTSQHPDVVNFIREMRKQDTNWDE